MVSRTLEKADWNTRVIGENVVEELTALKESGTTLLLFGGSALAAHLTEHGVIDEYRIFVHPVILGGGKPVFQKQRHRVGLELVESRTFDSQVVMLRHRRAAAQGDPRPRWPTVGCRYPGAPIDTVSPYVSCGCRCIRQLHSADAGLAGLNPVTAT